MTDGGQDFNLGHVVGSSGADGSTIWNTSTAPTYANSKYTFTISNLTGKTGFTIAVNDLIFYDTYYYIVSAVNSTTVDCTTRISIKGSDASVTIVDNLTSTSTSSALSAKQGKVLNDNKLAIAQTSYKGKNVVVDSTTGNITFENKPTIPTKVSDLSNDSGFITSSSLPTKTSDLTNDGSSSSDSLVYVETSATSGLLKSDGTVDTSTYLTEMKIGSTANLPVITGTSGALTTSSFGTSANTFCQGNDSRLSDSRTPTSHTHGQVTNDGKISSTAVTVASGDNILITDYSDSSKIKRVANILADHVKDSTAHSNIGSSANDTQATINSDIDTALSGKQATLVSGTNIKTVNNESLLGSGNITIQGGSNVDVVTSWEQTLSDSKVPSEKLTKNSLDDKISKSSTSGLVKNDGTIDTNSYITSSSLPTKTSDLTNDGADGTNVYVANNDSRLSDSRTPSSHTHGNLTNDGKVGSNANYIVVTGTGGAITSVQKLGNITYDGKIGSTSGKPVITTTSGTVTTGSFGSTAGTFAEGNHTHSGYISTSSTTGLVKNDGSIDTNTYLTSSAITGMLTSSDIADNLTTNDSTKVLSAKQGKALNDLIGAAITYINQ